ncbi:MAG: Clp1/GlmU family protein [candidate division WOR-3 bacterium]
MTIQEAWQDCVEKILAQPSRILVIGETTTGKTSFVTSLAQTGYKKGIETAVLDMDVGQSNIGPPTTIGLGFVREEINSLSEIKPEKIYFIGNTSPLGKEREFARGLKEILPIARKAGLLVVESVAFFKDQGFRDKMLALEIEIIKPDHIVVLKVGVPYQENSLADGGKVFSLPGMIKKSKRNLLQRKRFRIESWQRYLKEGKVYNLSQKRFLTNPGRVIKHSPFIGQAVGLTDMQGSHLAAGVVFEKNEDNLLVFAPPVKGMGEDNLNFIFGEIKVEGGVLNFIKEEVNEKKSTFS